MTDAAWVQLGLVATLVVTTFVKLFTDARDRRWLREDRRLEAEERRNVAAALAETTANKAEEVKQELARVNETIGNAHQELTVKIEDNTKITEAAAATGLAAATAAYTEANMAIKVANGMNEKLLRVQQMIMAVQPAVDPRRRADDV